MIVISGNGRAHFCYEFILFDNFPKFICILVVFNFLIFGRVAHNNACTV